MILFVIVKIPDYDATIEVTPSPKEQELSLIHGLAHYEGASSMKGIYKGKEVTGYGYVELVGAWK